jgi:glutamate--cysteine ligase catalytic subunit
LADTQSNIFTNNRYAPQGFDSMPRWPGEDSKNAFEEMTLDEIFNGKCCYFPGLIPLVYAYLEYVNCDNEIFVKVDKYLKFISM